MHSKILFWTKESEVAILLPRDRCKRVSRNKHSDEAMTGRKAEVNTLAGCSPPNKAPKKDIQLVTIETLETLKALIQNTYIP